jgi:phosphatidylethanolamine/phosphatidyl-N-methylethanolamine N-methyltransferase
LVVHGIGESLDKVTGVRNETNVLKYTRLAPLYDELFENRWIVGARRRVFSFLPELTPGARLLLDGVGTGADLQFVPANVHPVGVDLVEPMLRRVHTRSGIALPLGLMNAERLAFLDGSFEVVVLSLLLSVVQDGAQAFHEAVRVTRPGGYLLVFDKFAPAGRKPSRMRRLLNVATSAIGTDITRCLDDFVAAQPVEIIRADRSLLGGFYQATLFRRRDQRMGSSA